MGISARRNFLGALLAASLLPACGRKRVVGRRIAAGATVLALGDSLTFGTGAAPESSYPSVLARLTGWNVINAGVPGDTSAQELARLPALMQEHSPQLVLVSIGGNDFLRRMNDGDTRANIRRICEQAQAGGAQVLLIAVPALSAAAVLAGSLSDHPLYEEIADSLRLPLHAKGWSTVLVNAALRSDQIHSNAQGYELFARGLADAARTAQLL